MKNLILLLLSISFLSFAEYEENKNSISIINSECDQITIKNEALLYCDKPYNVSVTHRGKTVAAFGLKCGQSMTVDVSEYRYSGGVNVTASHVGGVRISWCEAVIKNY
mgnify:FL=1|jgi:hypothetical protein